MDRIVAEPMTFDPIYKPKVWGGDAFRRLFNRPSPAEPIGESWELADLEEDQSRVCAGPLAGATLHALLEQMDRGLLGDVPRFEGRFPLLIKFLDANENLSVQVHPTAEIARQLGGNVRVKHEAWYVLEARPQPTGPAGIYVGCKPGVTLSALRESVGQGTTPELLNFIPVQPGECYYLPSGTLHALGAGVVVAEVQTPSDITYRLYDWGRTGRELHVDQALTCVNPADVWQAQARHSFESPGIRATRLATCPYFLMELLELSAGLELTLPAGELTIWMMLGSQSSMAGLVEAGALLSGSATIPLKPGQTVLIPAGASGWHVRTGAGLRLIEVTVPAGQTPAHDPSSRLLGQRIA